MTTTRTLARPTPDTRRNGPLDLQPLHSVEMEKGVLSSMMVGGRDTIAECFEKISSAHFFDPAHQTIFNMLVEMWSAEKPTDLISLTQELRDRNLLEGVGGAAYVTELQTFVPTSANLDYYIDSVRDKHTLREIIKTGTEIVRKAHEEQADVTETVAFAKQSFEALHEPRRSDLPPIEDACELLSEPTVLPSDIIEGVVHQAGKAVIGGSSKSRKTWLQLDILVSIATGTQCLNGYATKKGPVLYVNFELPAAFCHWRIKKICEARQVQLEPGMFSVVNLRGRARDWDKVKAQIPHGRYVLTALDPTYKLYWGRDENRASDVALLMDELETFTERTGSALIFTHHFPKGNQSQKESIDRIAGSGVFGRDADSIITFTSLNEPDCFAVEINARNHRPKDKFAIRWQYPLFVTDPSLDPNDLKEAAGRPRAGTNAQLLGLIKDAPLRTGQWQKKADEEYAISRPTFYRMKDSLEDRGRIVNHGGLWYPKS